MLTRKAKMLVLQGSGYVGRVTNTSMAQAMCSMLRPIMAEQQLVCEHSISHTIRPRGEISKLLFPPMGAENMACVSFMEARALFLSYLLVSLLMRAKGL